MEINTTAGNRIREQVELMIQQQLRQVGIEITILNYPGRILFDLIERDQLKGLVMFAWVFLPTHPCVFAWLGYQNSEMERVRREVIREVDEGKRNKLLNESARIFSRDLPALPLYFRGDAVAAKSGLQNFTVTGLYDSSDPWNALQWFWESK